MVGPRGIFEMDFTYHTAHQLYHFIYMSMQALIFYQLCSLESSI